MSDGLNREGFTGPPLGVEEALAEVMARAGLPPGMRDRQAARDLAASTPAEARSAADWTIDPGTGRSNASPAFRRLAGEVDRLLRGGAGGAVLSESWTSGTAALIVAQLAHVHHLAPQPAAEPQPAPDLRALLDHETRLTWQSGLPGERARVAGVRESAGLEAL